MSGLHKVSVITPTSNRPEMLKRCIEQFWAQDYPCKQHIRVLSSVKDIIPEVEQPIEKWDENTIDTWISATFIQSGNIGAMRNAACEKADGDIILHMDDDDFYAPDWISKSVAKLQEGYDIVGLKSAYFYDEANKLGKLYTYSGKQGYCLGATMCYWKKTWERNKFNETVRHGEDSLFLANAGYVGNHDYIDGFTAMIHGNNTTSHMAFKTMPITNLHNIPYVKSRGI